MPGLMLFLVQGPLSPILNTPQQTDLKTDDGDQNMHDDTITTDFDVEPDSENSTISHTKTPHLKRTRNLTVHAGGNNTSTSCPDRVDNAKCDHSVLTIRCDFNIYSKFHKKSSFKQTL